MFYTPCEFGGLSIYISIYSLFYLLLFFVCDLAVPIFVTTPLCTTLEFSGHVVMFSLTLLCSNSLSSRSIVKPPLFPTQHFGRKTRVGSHLTVVATLVTADYRPVISCYSWSPGPEGAE